MKRLILSAIMIFAFSCITRAQVFLGGSAGFGYTCQNFSMQFSPVVGYEFSDKWAAAASVGFSYTEDVTLGIVSAYVRMNAWNNGKVFFDVKGITDFYFDDELELVNIGVSPSIRFRANQHWDFSADLGIFGAQYYDYEWAPTITTKMTNVCLNAVYRF